MALAPPSPKLQALLKDFQQIASMSGYLNHSFDPPQLRLFFTLYGRVMVASPEEALAVTSRLQAWCDLQSVRLREGSSSAIMPPQVQVSTPQTLPDGRDYLVATLTFNTKVTETSYLRVRTAVLAAYQEAVKMREAGLKGMLAEGEADASPDASPDATPVPREGTMIRRRAEVPLETKLDVRGGVGVTRSMELLKLGEMAGILSLGTTTLEPGATIGEHPHPNTEDLYLILAGKGVGVLNGERFPVAAGDLFLVKAGGSHGLINDSAAPLTFLGVLTRSPEPGAPE